MGLGLQVMICDRHSTIACNCPSIRSFLEVRIVFAFVVCDLCNFEMLDRWIQDSIVVSQELRTWIVHIDAQAPISTLDSSIPGFNYYSHIPFFLPLSRSSRNKFLKYVHELYLGITKTFNCF